MNSRRYSQNRARQHKSEQKGVALITMLLLLLLLTALSVSMVMAFSSDMFMNGYNRNFRASFYAADAGNTIIRQDISSRLTNMLPTTLPIGTYPLPTSAAATVVSAINSAYGSPIAINSTASFPESFNLSTANTSLTLYSCTVGYGTDATMATKLTAPTVTSTSLTTGIACPSYPFAYTYTYTYHYSLTTIGTAQGTGGTAVTDAGNIIVNATSEDTVNSFAQYGTFIDKMTICNGELVGGTITGTQFTNGSWTFGSDQTYLFKGNVGSSGANAGYLFGDGTCNQTAAPSSTHGGTTDSPTFQKGFRPSQLAITLPTDEFNQKSAVITGTGINSNGTEAPTPSAPQLTAALKDSSNNYSYTASTTSGVFVPVSSVTGLVNGGGIYVEGDATVTLSYSGTASQIYTITQGSFPTTTTVVTITPGGTPGSGTTTLKTGSNPTKTYIGVPTQTDPNTNIVTNAAVLYVDGNITSLSGTVQDNTALNVTAANDMIITDNLVYRTPVVDSSGNETAAEITAMAAGTGTQTLGLYTSGGSVYMKASSNNQDMEVDASIMTTKDNGGDCNFGSSCDGVLGVTGNKTIGTLKIVGGRIQSRAMLMPAGTIDQRNVFFDPRYNGTFAPPFFPKPTTIVNPPLYVNTLQRTGWVLQTAY